jgi:hypothetical protein
VSDVLGANVIEDISDEPLMFFKDLLGVWASILGYDSCAGKCQQVFCPECEA